MPKDITGVLFHFISQSICETLRVSNFETKSQEFVEENFPLIYKKTSLENIVEKLTKLIKSNQTLEGISLPYPNHIFQPKVQFAITIISQVLILEYD